MIVHSEVLHVSKAVIIIKNVYVNIDIIAYVSNELK